MRNDYSELEQELTLDMQQYPLHYAAKDTVERLRDIEEMIKQSDEFPRSEIVDCYYKLRDIAEDATRIADSIKKKKLYKEKTDAED